jgi:hypothetical protein
MKIFVRDILREEDDRIVPDHNYVVFGEGDDAIQVSVRDGQVEVSVSHGRICVFPRAANVVQVRRTGY